MNTKYYGIYIDEYNGNYWLTCPDYGIDKYVGLYIPSDQDIEEFMQSCLNR